MTRYLMSPLSHYFSFSFIFSILWDEWVGSVLQSSQVFHNHFKTWTTTLDIVSQLWSHSCLTQKTGALLLLSTHYFHVLLSLELMKSFGAAIHNHCRDVWPSSLICFQEWNSKNHLYENSSPGNQGMATWLLCPYHDFVSIIHMFS